MDAQARQPYSSDLTDAQWAILEPLLPPPVAAGAPRKTNFREVLNAIFYVLTSGCAWHALPHYFPPEGTVRYYFHRWRRCGLWEQIHNTLRRQVREHVGKEPEPSARLSSPCVFRTLYFMLDSGPTEERFSCRGGVMNDDRNATRKTRKLRASRDLWKQRCRRKTTADSATAYNQ